MTSEAFVLFLESDIWRIGVVDGNGVRIVKLDTPTDAQPQEKAQKAFEFLKEMGCHNQTVAVALDSTSCICAKITTADLPHRNKRQTMLYRLEEKLPVAVEDFVADFVSAEDHALGVCVRLQQVEPIIKLLEDYGVGIDLISPAALLALQSKLRGGVDGECDVLLWASDIEYCNFFLVSASVPTAWYRVSANPDNITRQLKLLSISGHTSMRVACCNTPQSVLDVVKELPGVQLVGCDEQDIAEAAVDEAGRILAGKQASLINLRRDTLAAPDPLRPIRKPLITAAIAAVLCLICLNGVLWWWAMAYKHYASEYESQQRTIFTQLFPDARVPIGVKSRLTSEQRRLGGLRGEDAQLSAQEPVLLYLRDTLAQMPADTRYRILEMQINEQRLSIEGQAQTHGGADAIAAALNRKSPFQVDPPRTENLPDQGISFAIRGTRKPTESEPIKQMRAEVP